MEIALLVVALAAPAPIHKPKQLTPGHYDLIYPGWQVYNGETYKEELILYPDKTFMWQKGAHGHGNYRMVGIWKLADEQLILRESLPDGYKWRFSLDDQLREYRGNVLRMHMKKRR